MWILITIKWLKIQWRCRNKIQEKTMSFWGLGKEPNMLLEIKFYKKKDFKLLFLFYSLLVI